MSTYSNWREDLIEVIDTPTTEKKAEKKIKETKVNNKVVINPTFKEAVAKMGGELLEVAEVDDKKDTAGTTEDPQIKSKEKRAGMIKRQVLLKKLQAVRAGGGADITAGYEPEGDQLDEGVKGADNEMRKMAAQDRASGKDKRLSKKEGEKNVANMLRKIEMSPSHNKEERVFEGVMKFIKSVGKQPEKKAKKATDAGARARRKLQQKDHETVNFLPMEEGKGYQPEIEHSKMGDAKKKADKKRESKLPPHLQGDAIGKMKKAFASEGEDKAYNYVLAKLKAKHGSGVLTKGDKMPEPSAAQKKKNAEIRAKRAKEDGRDATEKASSGRYSDRYSNRGSD